MQLFRKYRQGFSLLLTLLLVQSLIPISVFAGGDNGFEVDSLTIQPGETIESVRLNWYAPVEEIGEGTASVRFSGTASSESVSVTEPANPTGKDDTSNPYAGYKVCRATVTGLEPDTVYTYQISNDGVNWSKEYTYAVPKADDFTFAFTSDPQIKESGEINKSGWNPSDETNQTGWAKMMEIVADAGAALMVSAGDQVEDQSWGKKSEYDAFFAPEEMASIAYAPAVGNHDRHYMFADHFNLPNEMKIAADDITEADEDVLLQVKTTFRGQNSGSSLSHGNYTQASEQEIAENKSEKGISPNSDGVYDYTERRGMETRGNYYYLYNNILFVTLNTGAYPGGNDNFEGENPQLISSQKDNSEAEAIVENFKKTMTAATAKYSGRYDWLIVTHHKSTQTVAKHAADSDIENYVDAGFEQLMADFDVDFVLGGHDHVYSRSYVLNGDGSRNSERLDTINDPDGVIYLTGNCCSDMQYYTPFETVDKNNNTDYPVLANGETGSAAYLKGQNADNPQDYLPAGNQEYNQEYSPSYALFDVEGEKISVRVYNLEGSGENPASKEIDAFTVTKNQNAGEKIQGCENGSTSLDMEKIGGYDSGMTNADGGVMEIVDYNAVNGWAYAVNGNTGKLTAIPVKTLEEKESAADLLDGNDIDVKSLVEAEGFAYGDMTSVAVAPDGSMLAAAIQAEDYADNGRAALFTCNADGTLTFKMAVETGVQPDMITFTPDGSRILTANEGEPREGYGQGAIDPKGSVTVIDAATGNASTVGFEKFDHDTLAAQGIVLKKGTAPSEDLEPEYIACSNTKAYVSLQEANAIAVLDLGNGTFTGIYSAGFEDYSRIAVDIDKKDEAYNANTYESLRGIRMPDGISLINIGGIDYLLTANEGDSREWGDYLNEDERNFGKGKTSPTGKITVENSGLEGKVVFFDSEDYDGLESGRDYLFGGRSFTMFRVTESGLEEIFDSGSDFEEKTAEYLPEYFNCSNDDLSIDDRSGKKGPEPETVTVGQVNNRIYAFVTLERIGGIMVYDITDPENILFSNYINSRDFLSDIGTDDSPEGLEFVSAEKSPVGKALLLAACEVGGTVAVYGLTGADYTPPEIPLEGLDIAVISDDHLYDADTLGSEGEAFEAYLAGDRKLLAESEAILDAALNKIAESGVKYLLICGDLTKDGEMVNHELLAQKLDEFEKSSGIQVFVTNGNHDISNDRAVRFDADTTSKVESATTEQFREIYGKFGYDEAVAKDSNSLSYAVNLGDDYRLIVMDSCIYNDESDFEKRRQETGGEFSDSEWNWILEQIEDAVRDGRRPIGMMHHGLVPHTEIQPSMFSEYLLNDYERVAAALANAGMNLVFTGHFHSQDAAVTETEKGNVLYDVETGSLVTSPCPIRYVTLSGDKFSYTTESVTKVQGIEDFSDYANNFLLSGMEGLVENLLPGVLIQNGIPVEQAGAAASQLANKALSADGSITVKSMLANAFSAHYIGDESMPEDVKAIVQALYAGIGAEDDQTKGLYQLLANAVTALYTDSETADRNAVNLSLSQLPEYSGGNGGSSGGNGASSGGGSSNSGIDKPSDNLPNHVCPSAQFTDINTGQWHHEAIDYVVKSGMMNGISSSAFHPEGTTTRGMIVTILYRLENEPAAGSVSFTDVKENAYYAKAVAWAAANGIVTGKSDTVFDPDTPITREEMAAILYRYASYKGYDVNEKADLAGFSDTAQISSYAKDALSWANAHKLITGVTAVTLQPKGNTTRAQAAVILMRFCVDAAE